MKKLILISNYVNDNQHSMLNFFSMLKHGYKEANIEVTSMSPKVIFGLFSFNYFYLNKVFGYLDKFLIFPLVLIFTRLKNSVLDSSVHYHICDHSNSFYLLFLPNSKTIITCHDVLAIRGSLGFKDSYCKSSFLGKWLQKIIFYSLSKAKKIAAVSNFTLKQLTELEKKNLTPVKKRKVIHNALQKEYFKASSSKNNFNPGLFPELKFTPYIFHLGGSHKRKNRILLIEMMYSLHNHWNGKIIFAGEKLSTEEVELIDEYQLKSKFVIIENPDIEKIKFLYSNCEAFIFPSFAEGFGWPIIEAQACGSPVITSNIQPMMKEIGGEAALYADPKSPIEFGQKFLSLNDLELKKKIVIRGLKNCERFRGDQMIETYISFLYGE